MTKRIEIKAEFRGDPEGTGHAKTLFRAGQYADVPDAFADLVASKGLAEIVEGSIADAPLDVAQIASPALRPLVDAVASHRNSRSPAAPAQEEKEKK